MTDTMTDTARAQQIATLYMAATKAMRRLLITGQKAKQIPRDLRPALMPAWEWRVPRRRA